MTKFCRFILFKFFVFISAYLSAQNLDLEWVKSCGGIGGDQASFSTLDKDANIYTTGIFSDSVDFDPGTGYYTINALGNSDDVFIQKLDSKGELVWAKSIASYSHDGAAVIKFNGLNAVYLFGGHGQYFDADPSTSIHYLIDKGTYIIKLDTGGNFIWARSISKQTNGDMILDDNENIIIHGNFTDTIDLDPGLGVYNKISNGMSDSYIAKIDKNGTFIWGASFGGLGTDAGVNISLDNSGNIYLVGRFNGSVDFDPGLGTYYMTSSGVSAIGDTYVLKLNASGNFIWAKSFDNFTVPRIACDSKDNIYLTFNCGSSYDLDPGPNVFYTDSSINHIALVKLDSSGSFIWAKTASSMANGLEGISHRTVVHNNYIYNMGIFQGQYDFDPDTSSNILSASGTTDSYIQKYSLDGKFLWATSFGGNHYTNAYDLHKDSTNIYVTGYFGGTTDFDPNDSVVNLTSNGGWDFFVQKFNCLPDTFVDVVSSCGPYKWIDGNTYSQNNNTAIYTFTRASDCDSIVSLNLTVNYVNTLVSSALNTITANALNATYQWLDCNNNYSIIPGATSRNFVPSVNGSYAVVITENNCSDTSICVEMTHVSIEESFSENAIDIIPNPSSGQFKIIRYYKGTSRVKLYSPSGNLIYDKTFEDAADMLINLHDNVSNGIYFIELIQKNEVITSKIVVQRP